jgi:hypothetical protein
LVAPPLDEDFPPLLEVPPVADLPPLLDVPPAVVCPPLLELSLVEELPPLVEAPPITSVTVAVVFPPFEGFDRTVVPLALGAPPIAILVEPAPPEPLLGTVVPIPVVVEGVPPVAVAELSSGDVHAYVKTPRKITHGIESKRWIVAKVTSTYERASAVLEP